MKKKTKLASAESELRHRAEVQLNQKFAKSPQPASEADTTRLLHELQVHQIELELQNAELQEARDKAESLLEIYTELYDFAPVGYFSIDEKGMIIEVNLTGAALLGVVRARLLNQPLQRFVDPPSRKLLLAFLKQIFADPKKHVCELPFLNERGIPFWADLQAVSADSTKESRKWCRISISDLTTVKHEQQVQQRLEEMTLTNSRLELEIVQRQKTEEALKTSESQYVALLEQSHHQQEQLRHLARQLLLAQEEERKRISRELHDGVIQTLVGINVHLASLSVKSPINLTDLKKNMARTQQLVRKSVDIVHRFARELRPTVLDDLGLIPALQTFIKEFTKRTRIPVHLKAFAGVEQLDDTQRTVLYRVIQSALVNVEMHSNANQASVSIQDLRGVIRMEVRDNGKSFDAERVLFAKRHKRLGLLGSRERVEMVGGTFGVQSSPGQGTIISADIPIADSGPEGVTKVSLKTKRNK